MFAVIRLFLAGAILIYAVPRIGASVDVAAEVRAVLHDAREIAVSLLGAQHPEVFR